MIKTDYLQSYHRPIKKISIGFCFITGNSSCVGTSSSGYLDKQGLKLTEYLTSVNDLSELLMRAADKCRNEALKEVGTTAFLWKTVVCTSGFLRAVLFWDALQADMVL